MRKTEGVALGSSRVPKNNMTTRGILAPALTDCRSLPDGAAVDRACVTSAAFLGASFGPQPHMKISAPRNPRRFITESPHRRAAAAIADERPENGYARP